MEENSLNSQVDAVAQLIIGSKKVIFFTGAGISTESGIPDFRSPGGIWENFNPGDFTYQKFTSNAETRRIWWQLFRERGFSSEIRPNAAHHAIAELERMGKLTAVITQNIDNLHQMAGVPEDKVLELHGNIKWTRCLNCGRLHSYDKSMTRLEAGEKVHGCTKCGGILKPGIVFFGEMLSGALFDRAFDLACQADLLIVVGSTLIVYPAAQIPLAALESGTKLVIINLSSTPLDSRACAVIRTKASQAMTRIIESLRCKR